MADTTYLKENLQGFVPTPTASEIIADVVRGSSVMRLSKVQPMISETQKFPVMTEGPGAYWVGETERIKTSVATWIFPELVAKKIGVIVPCSKEKLEDTTTNVFAEIRPYIAEAFYKAIDAACLFGTNSPFAKNIFGVASTGGRVIAEETNPKLDLDISDVMALVENGGLDVNGFVAGYDLKNSLRKLRDANGNQLFVTGVDSSTLYSQPIEFARNGASAHGTRRRRVRLRATGSIRSSAFAIRFSMRRSRRPRFSRCRWATASRCLSQRTIWWRSRRRCASAFCPSRRRRLRRSSRRRKEAARWSFRSMRRTGG